jgi:hypothetical protein
MTSGMMESVQRLRRALGVGAVAWSLLAAAALTPSAAGQVLIRDNIAGNSWQNTPYLRPDSIFDTIWASSAIGFTGNGQRLGTVSLLSAFRIGGNWGIPEAGWFTIRVGVFTSIADYQADPFRVTVELSTSQLNPNWQTPFATVGGVPYLKLDLDLSGLGFITTTSGTNLVAVSFDDQTILPGAIGHTIAAMGGFGTPPDDYYRLVSGSLLHNGPLTDLATRFGFPQTHFAAAVSTLLACPADFDGSGFVDSDDFVAYVDNFVLGCAGPADPDPACTQSADFDGSTFVDSDDFVAFVAAFEAGC